MNVDEQQSGMEDESQPEEEEHYSERVDPAPSEPVPAPDTTPPAE